MELSPKVCPLQQFSGLGLMVFLDGQFLHGKEIKSFTLWEGLPSGGEGWFLVTDPSGRMIDANDPDQSLFLN